MTRLYDCVRHIYESFCNRGAIRYEAGTYDLGGSIVELIASEDTRFINLRMYKSFCLLTWTS